MRRRVTIAVAVVALAAVIGLVLTRDGGGSGDDRGPSRFPTRTQEAGAVTVQATIRRLDPAGATARIVFDTHTVELDLDVATAATLTVRGTTWPTEGWDGDGPGGHHREGDLRFAAAGPPDGEAVLTVAGLSEPLAFRWAVEP